MKMKKLFQKLLGKLLKKAFKKSVSNEVENPELIVPATEPEVELTKSQETCVKPKDPMWVIVLKVIAYIIGLILGGVVTTSCAGHIL
jgi:hypothetical protein